MTKFASFLITACCLACLTIFAQTGPALAHDGGGGGGGGGGRDGASARSRDRGPHIEPIRGIEGFPTIPREHLHSFTGYVGNDGPARTAAPKKTPSQQLQALKQKLVGMIIEDLWKDKAAAAALASVPPLLAAYKAVDTASKVVSLTAMAAAAIDLKARQFRAPYTKAAAGCCGSGIPHSHPEGGYGLNPNTPMYEPGGGPRADMIPDSFWH